MVRYNTITVKLLDNTTIAYQNTTLKEVVKICMQPNILEKKPILLKLDTYCELYFNEELLSDLVHNQIDFEELFYYLKTDGLARNKINLKINDAIVEAGNLWLLQKNLCVLVSSDEFISTALDNRFKILQ